MACRLGKVGCITVTIAPGGADAGRELAADFVTQSSPQRQSGDALADPEFLGGVEGVLGLAVRMELAKRQRGADSRRSRCSGRICSASEIMCLLG